MKRIIVCCAACAVVLCHGANVSAQPVHQDRVGVLIELSGPGAPVADDCMKGLALGARTLSSVSGREIRLVYGDTQDDAKTAVSEFKRLADKEKVAAIVVVRSKIAMPLNPLSRELKLPLIGGVGHPRFVADNPYAIRFYPNAEAEASLLAKKAVELKLMRAASIVVADEYQLALQAAFEREIVNGGGAVAFSANVAPAEMDFRATITRLRTHAPDAVFASFLFTQEGIFLKQLREQAVSARVLSNYWIQKKEVIETSGNDAVEGSVFVEVDTGKPIFLKLASETYPETRVTPSLYLCYAFYGQLLEAQRMVGATDTFSTALQSVTHVPLPDGEIVIKDREAQLPLRARVIRNGQPQDFEP